MAVLAEGFSVALYASIEVCSQIEFSVAGGLVLAAGLLMSFAGAGIEADLAPLRRP